MHQVYLACLPEKQYIGLTGVGLAKRLNNLKDKQVTWLAGAVGLHDLDKLKPLGRKADVKAGLALEAAYTAMHWVENPATVRGGPWCRARLPSPDLRELRQLSEALEGKVTLADRVAVVQSVAAESAPDGSLNMHLRGACFRCKATFQKCSCKLFRRGHAQISPLPAARKSGRHKSRVGAMKSGTPGRSSGRHKSRVGAMKSGASGRHNVLVGSKVIKRPSSGKSGSQSSGAARRFAALHQPRGRRL